MSVRALNIDVSVSQQLKSAKAGVAMSCGTLVYMDATGVYQKADAVDIGSATRKDAIGIVYENVLVNQTISPVRWARIEDTTASFTIGSPVYLGASGAYTQTEPTTTIKQIVGIAISATEFTAILSGTGSDLDVGGDLDVDTITIGTSSAYRTYASNDTKVIKAYADLNGTSDERVVYLKAKFGGTAGSGEVGRFYSVIDGAVAQNHGVHVTSEITTGGSVTGQAVAGRFTAATGTGLTLTTGTINALRLDSDLNSAITGMSEGWLYITDLQSNKFTNLILASGVSTTMYATKSGASSTKGLKVSINGDTKYIMLCD